MLLRLRAAALLRWLRVRRLPLLWLLRGVMLRRLLLRHRMLL